MRAMLQQQADRRTDYGNGFRRGLHRFMRLDNHTTNERNAVNKADTPYYSCISNISGVCYF